MHRATPSSSTQASSSTHRSRRTRITRAQLLQRLETLGRPSKPLPIELPLPPADPSASGSKRKLDSDSQPGPSKRPRTSSVSESRRQAPPSSAHRSEPASVSHRRPNATTEDGELIEEPPTSRDDNTTTDNIPIRRPRRHPIQVLGVAHFSGMHERYFKEGVQLKNSGQARTMANERPDSPSYRKLVNPPPTNSSYHQYGNLMSRLECLEAVLDFCYAYWAKDFWHKKVDRYAWRGLQPFLAFTRAHWEQDAVDDREKALLGLLYMIEASVLSNKLRESARPIDSDNRALLCRLQKQFVEDEKKSSDKSKSSDGSESLATPPMLPSPASISSNGSTPPGKKAEETQPTPAAPRKGMPVALRNPEEVWQDLAVPDKYYTEVNWRQVRARKSESEGILGMMQCLTLAQDLFNLPMLAKLYPRTYKRILNTTFTATDEFHPDIEDEQGELFWPGQVMVNSGGVAWYCAVGKAMLKELGRENGYRGIDGAIDRKDLDGRDLHFKVALPAPWGELR
ncbi:hypothetical protein PsYK624_084120 [Phanerochaete sordida]|uniref:Uncharacterized protein n=1 Tax=Phanerochaete sordida TaxID=48140 RepID=A0A9P3GCB2_9APHY|nr:hypothetical protein PsYK624_084120 [Phanerochaete sordida]